MSNSPESELCKQQAKIICDKACDAMYEIEPNREEGGERFADMLACPILHTECYKKLKKQLFEEIDSGIRKVIESEFLLTASVKISLSQPIEYSYFFNRSQATDSHIQSSYDVSERP